MSRTESELREGLEHVSYELRMLIGALSVVGFSGPLQAIVDTPLTTMALRNGIVELRALHARNIAEFLLKKANDSEYLSAADYFDDFWLADRAAVGRVLDRASGEIAHLSTSRVTDGDHFAGAKSKAWPLAEYFPLLTHANSFVERLLLSDKLAWNPDLRSKFQEVLAGIRSLLAVTTPYQSVATGMGGPVGR